MTKLQHFAVALSAIFLLPCGLYAAQVATSDGAQFDRIEYLRRLLRIVYPDLLVRYRGDATFRMGFRDESFDSNAVVLILRPDPVPCRHSGVSTGSVQVPYCGQEPSAVDPPFFVLNISFRMSDGKASVLRMDASGAYMDEPLERVRKRFQGRVFSKAGLKGVPDYWSDADALEALQTELPKYGPQHKQEFLAAVPFKELEDLTGCRLNGDTVSFVVSRLAGEPPFLEWEIRGLTVAPEDSEPGTCIATFEPFAAHLTSLDSF